MVIVFHLGRNPTGQEARERFLISFIYWNPSNLLVLPSFHGPGHWWTWLYKKCMMQFAVRWTENEAPTWWKFHLLPHTEVPTTVLCRDAVSIFFSSKQNFPQMPFQSFYPFLCWQVAVNGKPLLTESDGEVLLLVLYATRWGQGGDGVVLPEGPPANFQVLVVSEFIARINYLPPFFPQAVFSLLLSLLRTHSIEFKDSRGQHKMIFIRS